MHLSIKLEASPEQMDYFEASARIRGTTRTDLMERIVTRVLDDQLILAVLDDNSAPVGKRQKLRRRRVPGRANKRYQKVGYAGNEKHGGSHGTF